MIHYHKWVGIKWNLHLVNNIFHLFNLQNKNARFKVTKVYQEGAKVMYEGTMRRKTFEIQKIPIQLRKKFTLDTVVCNESVCLYVQPSQMRALKETSG